MTQSGQDLAVSVSHLKQTKNYNLHTIYANVHCAARLQTNSFENLRIRERESSKDWSTTSLKPGPKVIKSHAHKC